MFAVRPERRAVQARRRTASTAVADVAVGRGSNRIKGDGGTTTTTTTTSTTRTTTTTMITTATTTTTTTTLTAFALP